MTMAANTFSGPVVFKNKTYTSATVALDDYISTFDNSKQKIRSKYDRDIQNLFLSTPNASGNGISLNTSIKGAVSPQRALVDSSLVLSRVAIDNTSTLPSAANSDQNLLKRISSMTTDELLTQKPVWKTQESTARKNYEDTLFNSGANLRMPGVVESKSSMKTDSLVNIAPTRALLDDNQCVTTEYLLDIARRGAERAVEALTPSKPPQNQYISENSLLAIKRRIEDQLNLAESLRASIRHVEDSRSSGSGSHLENSYLRPTNSAEAEDVLLHSRLLESRKHLYDTMGLPIPKPGSLPESLTSGSPGGMGGVRPPSWIQDIENQSDTSSIISGNLLKQRLAASNKMSSTPSYGRTSQRRIRFDGTTSTIQPNDSRRSRNADVRDGAYLRSKSAGGRLIRDRNDVAEISSNSDRFTSSHTTSGSSPSQGQPIIGRGFQDIQNQKHREFIKSLQRDIEDSKSSLATSTVSAVSADLMDSIPHAMKGSEVELATNGVKDYFPDRIRDLMCTPSLDGQPTPTGLEKTPDTDVILSGDRPWEKPQASATPQPGAQAGSMETLKQMLFSLQSFSEPPDPDLTSSPTLGPIRNLRVNQTDQSGTLDDSTAELLRQTKALTSDMENKLAPLMHTVGSSNS